MGNGVIWGEADVGVVPTQAIVDASYGPKALELLRQGLSLSEVVERVLAEDPDPLPDRWPKAGRQPKGVFHFDCWRRWTITPNPSPNSDAW
ncbi:MAG: hypothetical protein KatS3mg081_2570 [Gemmatimonadales bacterium]|nr:MAG: hypothetical protein KatS3mg081_2570 [Gemmatimonadales bacterium]